MYVNRSNLYGGLHVYKYIRNRSNLPERNKENNPYFVTFVILIRDVFLDVVFRL